MSLFQIIPSAIESIAWHDALLFVKAVAPTGSVMGVTAYMIKRIWNGNNQAMQDIKTEMRSNNVGATAARDAMNFKLDSYVHESRGDRDRLNDRIASLVDRTSRIEGSCLLHGNILREAVGSPEEKKAPRRGPRGKK
ncbi:MAG TPA: hypothetical protein VM487_13000 [Phycisphaerae bacterium]|nr:hypothetical protein [Phycisphaerae bacterium]